MYLCLFSFFCWSSGFCFTIPIRVMKSVDMFMLCQMILLTHFWQFSSYSVYLWRRLRRLHRPSGWAPVVPLCADSSHQSNLPASIPAATIHRQAPGYRVSARAKCTTVHGLRQGSSLWVNNTFFTFYFLLKQDTEAGHNIGKEYVKYATFQYFLLNRRYVIR